MKRLSFQTKVVAPVILAMVLLLLAAMWVVNQRFTAQMQQEANQALQRVRALLTTSQELRLNHLAALNRQVANEPRIKALIRTDAKTLEMVLQDILLREIGLENRVDAVLYADESGRIISEVQGHRAEGDVTISAEAASIIQGALSGEVRHDIVQAGTKLFQIVAVPIFVQANRLAGILAFASEIGWQEVAELKGLTGSEVVLVAPGAVIASTLEVEMEQEEMLALHSLLLSRSADSERLVELEGDRYLAMASVMGNGGAQGIVLLSSLEGPLSELRATQQLLAAVTICGILLGSLMIWALVRRLTEPLRQLRDGAEAVGSGDFSRSVEVQSEDECGQLARSFNKMVANLKQSREDHDKTVDRLQATRAQLLQSEKLSAVGEFVAGVTHELNNPLTAVVGFAELLQQSFKPAERNWAYLEQIVGSAQRCHRIVRSLLSFARQHRPERKRVNLNELVESTLNFVRYEFHTSNIEIEQELSPDLPLASMDPHQIQQVLLNLSNNARQAMEDSAGRRRLLIRTDVLNGHVRVIVEDTGPGIPGPVLSKIFDPFFTTKEVGKGTGLGLSLSYGIIQEHGGTIRAQNIAGGGAQFTICLPREPLSDHHDGQVAVSDGSEVPAAMAAGRRVLVVDDEEPILELARSYFASFGCVVDVTPNGREALECALREKYDLILCDWKMPGMNGREIFEQLTAKDPVKAEHFVFMTGDVVNERIQEFLKKNRSNCVSKPFSLEELRGLVVAVEA